MLFKSRGTLMQKRRDFDMHNKLWGLIWDLMKTKGAFKEKNSGVV
jgi:hypothetical protein